MEAQDETRLERQLKKGVLEMLVLRLVCQKPGHGYELLARMDRRSHGAFRLKEGTLYPILYRLEDDGLIVSSWQTGGEGRAAPKKIYTATPAGRAAQAEQRRLWDGFIACVQGFDKEDADEKEQ